MTHRLTVCGDEGVLKDITDITASGITSKQEQNQVVFTAESFEDMSNFKRHLSKTLAGAIERSYEPRLARQILSSAYFPLLPCDIDSVLSWAKRPKNDKIIEEKLLGFLSGSDTLLLDGFINFRLKDYKKRLKETLFCAAESYLAEKEYKEFINLLRAFVNIQEPCEELINIVIKRDGTYMLLNSEGRDITSESVREFIDSTDYFDVTFDDIILSSLISAPPAKVVLHGVENALNVEIINTLCNVFEHKVSICNGCDLCK